MSVPHDRGLDGLRTLVVEDDFFVAESIVGALSGFACVLVGPVSSVTDACRLAEQAEIDVALLDAVIRGGNSEPVAMPTAHESGVPLRDTPLFLLFKSTWHGCCRRTCLSAGSRP